MAYSKQTLVDIALIFGGACMSILFVSTDGNGQNPIPVAGTISVFVLVTGAVSFFLARFIRSSPFAIISSVIIKDLLIISYAISAAVDSRDPHAAEMVTLLPIVVVVATAPTVALCSIGFVRLAHRIYRRRKPLVSESQ